MKNFSKLFTLLLIAVVFAAPKSSFAQDGKKNVIKTNILSPIVGSYNFFYERAIGEKTSIQLGFGFTSLEILGTKLSGFRITPEFRYYPSSNKQAPKGFYIAPFGNYQSLSLTTSASVAGVASAEGKATLTTIGGGLDIGYQWLFGDVVSLDLFLGPSVNSGSVKVEASSSASGFTESNFSTGSANGFGLRFGLSLGIAF